jgi:virginiamycin B lyase
MGSRLLTRVASVIFAGGLLCGAAASSTAADKPPYVPPPQPAGPAHDGMSERGLDESPIYLESCQSGTNVTATFKFYSTLDVTYNIRGTRTADAVEFLVWRDVGPQYTVAVRDTGTFAPDTPIHHSFTTPLPWFSGTWYGASHCSVTAAHFTDGTEWRAPGQFLVAERPEILAELGMPSPKAEPQAVAIDASGRPWVAETALNRIAVLDPGKGTPLAQYALPSADNDVRFLAPGPNGSMWFTETKSAKIGVIDAAGTLHEYPVPCNACAPTVIAAGPDGRMWFAETKVNAIGVIAADGQIAQYPIPTPNAYPGWIAPAKDGTVWFEENVGKIGRLAADGKLMVELAATPANGYPQWIGQDPSGAIRFVATRADGLVAGTVSARPEGGYQIVAHGWRFGSAVLASGAAFDASGAMWTTEVFGNRVLRIAGDKIAIMHLGLTRTGHRMMPASIVTAPDGTLWYTESAGNAVVHMRVH